MTERDSGVKLIIAEVGQNFCGDLVLAKTLIVLAKNNGADLVKFQLYDTDNDIPFSNYPKDSELYRLGKESELTKEQACTLYNYGILNGIEVFFSVFDVERVAWCEEIGVKRYKVAFSRSNDQDILEALYQTRKNVIVSTRRADKRVTGWSFLYCIPNYPALYKEMHFSLNLLDSYWDGFSDHTIGLDAAKIALARGAKIIEKHFAIDHKTGVDAPWSMTQEELRELKRWEGIVSQVL